MKRLSRFAPPLLLIGFFALASTSVKAHGIDLQEVAALGQIQAHAIPYYVPECGNSHIDPGEQCDNGGQNGSGGCGVNCQLQQRQTFSFCGNHRVESDSGEQCDDGNQKDGDGCDKNCKWEPPRPSNPVATSNPDPSDPSGPQNPSVSPLPSDPTDSPNVPENTPNPDDQFASGGSPNSVANGDAIISDAPPAPLEGGSCSLSGTAEGNNWAQAANFGLILSLFFVVRARRSPTK